MANLGVISFSSAGAKDNVQYRAREISLQSEHIWQAGGFDP